MNIGEIEKFADRLIGLGAIKRNRPVDWLYYEKKIGFALPQDYKALLNHVCGFTFINAYNLLEPHFREDDPRCILGQEHFTETYAIMQEHKPKTLWRPLPPCDQSFVFWAYNAGQHGLAWEVMDGEITDTILAVDIEDVATVMETKSMSETLRALIDREIIIPGLEHRDEDYIDPIKPIASVEN